MILLLDGGKGAGKSTLVEGLSSTLMNANFLSLDVLRKKYTDGSTTNENNAVAYEKMIEEIIQDLRQGRIAVLDSGMTQERVNQLEQIAQEEKTFLKKVHLFAPKETLWERVVARHETRNKDYPANRERFDYTYGVLMDKDFSGFTKIDTSQNNPKEVLTKVLDEIPTEFKIKPFDSEIKLS